MNFLKKILGCLCGKKAAARKGTVKFYDRKKRFGFIVSQDQEYFFHGSALVGQDYKKLRDGSDVQFTLIKGKKGPQADNITIL